MGAIIAELLLVQTFLLSLLPFWLVCFTSYVLARQKILTNEHRTSLSLYIFWIGLPSLVFKRIALLHPEELDGLLLAADVISKIIPLSVLICWYALAKNGCFGWVISVFGHVCIPNTVVIGDAILDSLYGSSITTKTTTLIFAQSLCWYNFLICMHEIREVFNERGKQDEPVKDSTESDKKDNQEKPYVNTKTGALELQELSNIQSPPHGLSIGSPRKKVAVGLEFASSTPKGRDVQCESWTQVTIFPGGHLSQTSNQHRSSDNAFQQPLDKKTIDIHPFVEAQYEKTKKESILLPIIIRILKNTLTWASALSMSYCLLAAKFHLTMPNWMVQTLTLMSSGSIVTSAILLGMAVGHQNSIILCSKKVMVFGWGLRFLIAPVTMAAIAYALGIKGKLLRYAIVQTLVPQGNMVYALAVRYKNHEQVIATAVFTQMIVFIPILLGVYSMLEAFR